MTERFTAALHTIDSDRDVAPMLELTGDDAEPMKLDERNETSGKDGGGPSGRTTGTSSATWRPPSPAR